MKKILVLVLTFLMLLTTLSFAAVETGATAAVLIESSTGKVIYEKNSDSKQFPASITKVLTALIVLNECELNEEVKVSSNAVLSVSAGSSIGYLKAGETFTVEQLLYAMLVASGNDAANVLAEHVAGTTTEFAKLMNEKAKEVGAKNSNFTNANGLHDENHYITAYDMALITNAAMKNETFRKIVATKTYTMPSTDIFKKTGDNERVYKNTNLLLFTEAVAPNTKSYYYEYATGVKTGYTSKAGNCLIASAEKDGMSLICVLLNVKSTETTNRYIDAVTLFNFGFSNYTLTPFTPELPSTKIENSNQKLEIELAQTSNVLSTSTTNLANLTPKISLKTGLLAPILKGANVGTVEYEINNEIYTFDLVAKNDVNVKSTLGEILWSIFIVILKIIGWLLISLIVFAIIVRLYKQKVRKQRRAAKRYKSKEQ